MLNIFTHKNILVMILKEIFTNHAIASSLGFKGGTAALLFYNLPRFSVDLDLDLLDPSKEELVFNTVQKILTEYGQVKMRNKRYSIFFLLSYQDKLSDAQNIKVEINKRDFGSQYEIKQFLGISMQIMIQADMAAHKMVAMYERVGAANRDIFDTWFFLSNNWPVNKTIIEMRTDLSYKDFLQACINLLEKLSNQSILSGLGELLNTKQKAWVKSKLKDETIFQLKLALENISKS